MNDVKEILELEEKYKKLLMDRFKGDERLSLSCPGFKYPEPVYVYIKSVDTGKTIAVRLDGGDKTMRFWDYVDDDYSDEDGVWDKMSDKGLETFVKKLYAVMDRAFDIDFYTAGGECEDYYSGLANFELNASNAQKAVKKYGIDVSFAIAKFSNFFGDVLYCFDKNFNRVIKK